MFENVNVPLRLNNCPLVNCALEIRFDAKLNFRTLSSKLFDSLFGELQANVEDTAIAKLPDFILENDNELKYKPLIRCIGENRQVVALGSHCIIFEHLAPYSEWHKWSGMFYKIIDSIKSKGVFERIGSVRYKTVDCFSDNIFKDLNLDVTINGTYIKEQPINFTTVLTSEGHNSIVNINTMNSMLAKLQKINTVITIEGYKNLNENDDFFSIYRDIIEKLHITNKKIFFGLLKEDIIRDMGAEYADC